MWYQMTDKGAALLKAIGNGNIPETETGWNITEFERLWDAFEKSGEPSPELIKMVGYKPDGGGKKRDNNTKRRNKCLYFVVGLLLGCFTLFLFKLL